MKTLMHTNLHFWGMAAILLGGSITANASVPRTVAGGLLSVQQNTGSFSGISPIVAVKADLVQTDGFYELKLVSGSREMSFKLDAPKAGSGDANTLARTFEGVSAEGLKVVFRDSTSCPADVCLGPSWRATVIQLEGDEEKGELAVSGDATIYPEAPVKVEAPQAQGVAGPAAVASPKAGVSAQAAGSVAVSALPPADLGSYAPDDAAASVASDNSR